uniref:Uncharacterized protein n=1 Tax=Amphimedon queenslandica TaxID=400682 RepID=A0A1X7UMP9_AMPQE
MATAATTQHAQEEPLSPLATKLSQPPYQLHEAVFKGDAETVKTLLEEDKSVVNVPDCHGNTPLHLAVMLGNEAIIKLLVSYNASARSKNSLGWTPLNESVSYGDRTISLSTLELV